MQITLTTPNEQSFAQIHELINFYAERREMLPKTLDEIYHQMRGFRVLVSGDEVIGCAHLDIFGPDLAEIKSLAIKPEYAGQGHGSKLVEDCLREAGELGITKVFALTYRAEFFHKLGFETTNLESLPEKVFKECVVCPFYGECNETAVIKNITASQLNSSS